MKPEHSYYIDRLQLMLLLSLLDRRPVVCIPMGDLSGTGRETWEQVALSLTSDGLLCFEAEGPVIRPDVRALLEGMKAARRVLALYSGREGALVSLLYLGKIFVSMGLQSPTEYRIRQLDTLSEEWLSQEAALSQRLPDPAAARTLMEHDSEVIQRLEELEQSALPIEEPSSAWAANPHTRAVADLFDPGGELLSRRVWLDDPLCPVVLWQNAVGCAAQLDSVELRERFLRECQGCNEEDTT